MDATTRAQKEARLAVLKQAYDALITGQQARVIVDRNGERVDFTAAKPAELRREIALLENELSKNGGRRSAGFIIC